MKLFKGNGITDLYYRARGREYFKEDIYLSELLRDNFHVIIVHLDDLDIVAPHVDAILIRNTGPKSEHEERLRIVQKTTSWPVFNDLRGKGDICGKRHLLDLFAEGYPVVPTIGSVDELHKLGELSRYLIKPIDGCDSHGLQFLQKDQLSKLDSRGYVIQPAINFQYEVSFYFVGDRFQYALYAPDPSRRWELQQYLPEERDLAFAETFVTWNSCSRGIQRVDACRDESGELLLMELEDYNPFLSLELLEVSLQRRFVAALSAEIEKFASETKKNI